MNFNINARFSLQNVLRHLQDVPSFSEFEQPEFSNIFTCINNKFNYLSDLSLHCLSYKISVKNLQEYNEMQRCNTSNVNIFKVKDAVTSVNKIPYTIYAFFYLQNEDFELCDMGCVI